MLKIHGVPFSAHTRKVIVAAIEKGIAHEVVPVIPLTPRGGCPLVKLPSQIGCASHIPKNLPAR
jgi:hypothetical protein